MTTDPQILKLVQNLKSWDKIKRAEAANSLGEIRDSSAVPALCEALKDAEEYVRRSAADALGEIKHSSAVSDLCEAFRDECKVVRRTVAWALGECRDPSSIPILRTALKDEDEDVRWYAAQALGEIRDPSAVSSLCEALTESEKNVRESMIKALLTIGDQNTLPRKILASDRIKITEKDRLLSILRNVRYSSPYTLLDKRLEYGFPETRKLCEIVLQEDDDAARRGAQAVLNWIDGDSTLLHPSLRDDECAGNELLRPVATTPETQPNTLIRASQEPEKASISPLENAPAWTRFFRKN